MIQLDYCPHKKHPLSVKGKTGHDKEVIWGFRASLSRGNKYYESGLIVIPSKRILLSLISHLRQEFNNENVKLTDSFMDYFHREMDGASELLNGYIKNRNVTLDNVQRYNAKLELMKHQNYGVDQATNLPFYGFLWDMGTGKTAAALVTIQELIKSGKIDFAIVVAPLSILDGWAEEVGNFTNLKFEKIRGTKKKKEQIMINAHKYDILALNYESLLSLRYNNLFLDLLHNRTAMFLDESTAIKNPEAKRTKFLLSIARFLGYRSLLNGTPVTQSALDVWSQFTWLTDYNFMETTFDGFKNKYFVNNWGRLEPKKGTMELIKERIEIFSSRFLKSECIDLPEVIFTKRKCLMTGDQKEMYTKVLDKCIAEIEDMGMEVSTTIILTKLLRLAQITSGFVGAEKIGETNEEEKRKIVRFKDNAKLKEVENIIRETSDEIQFIIWSRFQEDFKILREMCKKNMWTYCEIHGGIKENLRKKAQDDFSSKRARIFIGNPKSGGYGLNLVTKKELQVERCGVIYYCNSFSFGDRIQSQDRCFRKGQGQTIQYFDVSAVYEAKGKEVDTIDKIVLDAIKDKRGVADKISGDNARELLDLRN
jgi:hypothetical protein